MERFAGDRFELLGVLKRTLAAWSTGWDTIVEPGQVEPAEPVTGALMQPVMEGRGPALGGSAAGVVQQGFTGGF